MQWRAAGDGFLGPRGMRTQVAGEERWRCRCGRTIEAQPLFDQTCQIEAALAAPTSYARMDGSNGHIDRLGIAGPMRQVRGASPNFPCRWRLRFSIGHMSPMLARIRKNDLLLMQDAFGPVAAKLARARTEQDRLRFPPERSIRAARIQILGAVPKDAPKREGRYYTASLVAQASALG